ncbi:hypothetical protein BDZ89DRAFT_1073017 [Hymenopellis radicata]|nr:hypothetical protein BDZ89DRAFT_1073017 [Hymenopellis radicata]
MPSMDNTYCSTRDSVSKTSQSFNDDPFYCENEDSRRAVFSSPTSLRYKRDVDLKKTPIFGRHPLTPPDTCPDATIDSLRRELRSARSSERTALQRVAKLEGELQLFTDIERFRKVLKERDTLKRQEKLWEKECQLVLEELQMVKRRLYDAELRLLTMDSEELFQPQEEEEEEEGHEDAKMEE